MNASSRIKDKKAIGICGNGNFTDHIPGKEECLCCGKKFMCGEIAIELFEYDIVCPDCILSGPEKMAQHIRDKGIPIQIKKAEKEDTTAAWHIAYLTQIANTLEGKKSITDFPRGIFAVKIAEAYREIQAGKGA